MNQLAKRPLFPCGGGKCPSSSVRNRASESMNAAGRHFLLISRCSRRTPLPSLPSGMGCRTIALRRAEVALALQKTPHVSVVAQAVGQVVHLS